METYDPAKIGSRIAWGRSHSVYRYGQDEVIKFPRLESLLGGRMQDRLERDISVCQRYFGDLFLDTRLVTAPEGKNIASIQPFVSGHYLAKADLEDATIKAQFDDLMERYDRLLADGYAPIDLIGQGGVLRRCLSNVLVLGDKRLKIFDASILDMKDIKRWRFAAGLVIKFAIARQRSTLRYLVTENPST